MSPKSRKWDQKNRKNLSAAFRFSSFPLWTFYPTGINIGSKRPQHVLKHAKKQSETRRVQSFGAKSGASVFGTAFPEAAREVGFWFGFRAMNFGLYGQKF